MSKTFIVPGETITHPGLRDVCLEVKEILYVTDTGVCLHVRYHNIHMPEVSNYDEVCIKTQDINNWSKVHDN